MRDLVLIISASLTTTSVSSPFSSRMSATFMHVSSPLGVVVFGGVVGRVVVSVVGGAVGVVTPPPSQMFCPSMSAAMR